MDYEQQRGSDAEPGMPENDGAAESATDLGTESSLMSEADSTLTPPEWPINDLQRGEEAEMRATDDGMAAGNDEMPAADEAMDAGDDSDAPVQLDDVTPVMAAANAEGHLQADNVTLSQGGVNSIDANTVSLSQGGAGQVRADTMSVEQGGVGLARVNTLTLGSGASAFAVVADQATVEVGSSAFLVISRSLKGDARPTIDWRGAMAFGAGVGLVISILRRLR